MLFIDDSSARRETSGGFDGQGFSTTHLVSGTVTTTFQSSPCVREDVFSTTLQSNDTGYMDMTQTSVCGCPG